MTRSGVTQPRRYFSPAVTAASRISFQQASMKSHVQAREDTGHGTRINRARSRPGALAYSPAANYPPGRGGRPRAGPLPRGPARRIPINRGGRSTTGAGNDSGRRRRATAGRRTWRSRDPDTALGKLFTPTLFTAVWRVADAGRSVTTRVPTSADRVAATEGSQHGQVAG